jgi:hypothetical protein
VADLRRPRFRCPCPCLSIRGRRSRLGIPFEQLNTRQGRRSGSRGFTLGARHGDPSGSSLTNTFAPTVDLIQAFDQTGPGCGGPGEVEVKARAVFKPSFYLGMLVRPVIVADQGRFTLGYSFARDSKKAMNSRWRWRLKQPPWTLPQSPQKMVKDRICLPFAAPMTMKSASAPSHTAIHSVRAIP